MFWGWRVSRGSWRPSVPPNSFRFAIRWRLTSVSVDLECREEEGAVEIAATCRLTGRTGVEMEALTAASVAALTVYDMCKAVDRGMRIDGLRLLHKSGGKSGSWSAA